MSLRKPMIALLAGAGALAGCSTTGDLVVDQGAGITAIRSVCPAVGVPDYTGDITQFRTPGATTADAVDLTAFITNVRSTCDDTGERVFTTAGFDVIATRTSASGPRTVELPYFVTVLRGGSAVVTKRVGTVRLDFADGQDRTIARAQASSYVDKAEASLPADIRERITRKRKAGDSDAALDPLAEPEVRAAISRATFEMLIGFQLSEAQLAYNVTR